jgi:hypothetical protein
MWIGQTKIFPVAHVAENPRNAPKDLCCFCYRWLQKTVLYFSKIRHRPQSKGRDFLIDCIQKMTEMMTMIAEAISHQPHHQQF